MNKSKRFKWESRPEALKGNIISGGKYRFTVLTESLIRIEFDEEGKFEDRASQTVFFRDLPQVEYTTENKDGVLTVETEKLILTYYGEKKLSIKLKTEPGSVWNYGEDFDDLVGTHEQGRCKACKRWLYNRQPERGQNMRWNFKEKQHFIRRKKSDVCKS